jgi:Holliday junction resolvase RusA-like endonuclease
MTRAASSLEAPSPKSQKGFPPTGGKPFVGQGADGGAENTGTRDCGPDLAFRVDGMPPRKTLQSGRGAFRDEHGDVRFFTRADVRAEAWEMRAEFKRRLPAGWRARRGPVKVRVELVYPLRKPERARLAGTSSSEMLIPHFERPDADNLVKSMLDSMTRAGVWEDDGQVADLRVRKWRGLRPRWAVFVWFLPMPELPRRRRGHAEGPEQRRLALGPQDAAGTAEEDEGHGGASVAAARVVGHAGGQDGPCLGDGA